MRERSAGTLPFWVAAVLSCVIAAPCGAEGEQPAPATNPSLILSRVADGRERAAAGDVQSVSDLRALAQESLTTLAAATTEAEEAAAGDFETRTAARRTLRKAHQAAAAAHLAWGQTADRFAHRDEAVTALARALDLAGQNVDSGRAEPAPELADLQRESRAALAAALGPGLPLLAADDALEIIAAQAHGRMWKPQRFTFPLPPAIGAPAEQGLSRTQKGTAPPASVELLVTSGKLFPPDNLSARNGVSRLAQVPPLYRTVPAESLPTALKMDRLVAGYVRETGGADKGLWRQVVRVYYASTYKTRDSRDDRLRAEALCLQLLRVAALMKQGLGLSNGYSADGVTTLWLSEVSAWWPSDDDEPGVSDRLPPRMPQPNTPLRPQAPVQREVRDTPLEKPWRAAATLDSAPGEIIFFKMKEARPEGEWLRQAIHEYGHVALPPFDRFAPPLEPYGNGMVGETLGMLWASSQPDAWSLPGRESADAISKDLPEHAAHYALPALRQWQQAGPQSTLRRDRTVNGLRYLTGLALGLERTYGAPLLGGALTALARNGRSAAGTPPALTAESLLAAAQASLRTGLARGRTMPVWLGGVLDAKLTPAALAARAPLVLNNGVSSGWIFVPERAEELNIAWKGAPGARLAPVGWKTRTARAAAATGGLQVLSLDLKARGGWQKLSLSAKGQVTIAAASFEAAGGASPNAAP